METNMPRITGGRPATMTRSAVQQGRTNVVRPTTPTAATQAETGDDQEPPAADGWVSVDNNRRKNRQSGTTSGTGASASPVLFSASSSPSLLMGSESKATRSDERQRRRIPADGTSSSSSSATPMGDADDALVTRPHARADALSAAVTMDKKARERSYYTSTSTGGGGFVSSSPLSPPLGAAATTWGSPPLPPSGLLSMNRAKSSSADHVSPLPPTGPSLASATTGMPLDRTSSLQKLIESWQTMEIEAPAATSAVALGDPPLGLSTSLRRVQSDAPSSSSSMALYQASSSSSTSTGSRVRSPTGIGGSMRSLLLQDGKNASSSSSTNNNNNGNGNPTSSSSSRKCGDKRDFFFRNLDFETRNLLQIDQVASFSVTDFEMARKISCAIIELFPELQAPLDTFSDHGEYDHPVPRKKCPLAITDATACVGGNVLSFCDFFSFVYAIECDETRVSMLENNLRVLNKTNVSCQCASYLDVMYDYDQDVVFIDPPWGGPEYKELDKVDLFLGNYPLYKVCQRLRGHTKCVVLKVPTNFDDENFAACVSGSVTVRKDFKKMHLVVLDFRLASHFSF